MTTTQPRLTDFTRDRLGPPLVLAGGFFRMCVLTGKALFRPPFQWQEFVLQCWFIVRVSLFPTMAVSVPVTVLFVFTFNVLLIQVGLGDVSGAGTAVAVITQIGPIVTVLVVAGACATAICADLGARTIREEIDAMEVLGIDPIHRLVAPRVLAMCTVAMLLNGLVSMIGLVGGYIFGVYLQNISGGAYLSSLTFIVGLPEVVVATVKALIFGLIAGLVGCYRGLTTKGGAKGLGVAVNETVVMAVVLLYAVNVVLTAIGVRFGTGAI
ncbi:ABC transporter permease [Candidatus Mycobacterium methanotrophicum]|uniref:ABC transporter permease n=2 Tax=Candidatus Mycobacterium methanotrophicum TaxID=2943498 RepID=A0ABY4QLQ3_9MYCO|nr:ABC transporter permease [Candidatus Mycobacterium methanotrophicum]UQX10891.1 ABC transporter permease [Candidatus Mycobacterium methanotrophicum]